MSNEDIKQDILEVIDDCDFAFHTIIDDALDMCFTECIVEGICQMKDEYQDDPNYQTALLVCISDRDTFGIYFNEILEIDKNKKVIYYKRGKYISAVHCIKLDTTEIEKKLRQLGE